MSALHELEIADSLTSGVAVIGLGYVGCVNAACLADLGHHVVGVDSDRRKVRAVQHGAAPFYEPSLTALIAKGCASGRLSATTSLGEALHTAEIALICVGTPSAGNGHLSLEQIECVCAEIVSAVSGRQRPLIVAIRSTVLPGTCERILSAPLGSLPFVSLVANPEFLREGSAVEDFVHPSLVIVGGSDERATRRVARLYEPLRVEVTTVSLRSAELIKCVSNAFHAIKVAFANEVGAIAAQLGVDAHEVMTAFCRDRRLNVSSAYLRPGLPFGGSCLPKDLRALVQLERTLDLDLPLMRAVLPSNQAHVRRTIDRVLALAVRRLGVFGLAFKENTDDVRESPVVSIIEGLLAKGWRVRVFDPQIDLDAPHGQNLQYLLRSLPHIRDLLVTDLDRFLTWSDCVVVMQRPSSAHRTRLMTHDTPVCDFTEPMQAVSVQSDSRAHTEAS